MFKVNFSSTFAFLLLITLTVAIYDDNDNVIELTKLNFDKFVTSSDHVWIVQFYATWCDASTNMTDEFEKAATALKGAVKVGAIDADQHRIIAKRFEVTEVPTVMIFSGEYSFPYFEERSARALAEVGLAEVYSKVKDQFKSVTSNDDLFKKNVNTTTENV